jgi:hypothetical protein
VPQWRVPSADCGKLWHRDIKSLPHQHNLLFGKQCTRLARHLHENMIMCATLLHNPICLVSRGTRLHTGWVAMELGFLVEANIFLFFTPSRYALGHTWPPTQTELELLP